MTAMTPWVQTASGGRIDLIRPQVGQFTLDDIAHQLARINRFSGAIRWDHYSVAQHSVLCAHAAKMLGYPIRTQTVALLHDAHEIAISDINSPTKQAIRATIDGGCDPLEAIENALDSAIWESLFAKDVRPPNAFERAAVKRIDAWMCLNEARQILRGGPRSDWALKVPEYPELDGKMPIKNGWTPHRADREFRAVFRKLTSGWLL